MAKHKGNKGFRALRVIDDLALGALVDNVFITSDMLGSIERNIYAISIDLVWAIKNLTAGQGPIAVGLAHGDYTVTELLEWWNATGLLQGDQVAMERSRRKIRLAGIFNGLLSEESLNDGRPLRTKLKFTVGDGESFNLWAVNLSDGTLTTGAIVDVSGTFFCRMIRG